jgi:putative addiction module component (TIGR02574 family)
MNADKELIQKALDLKPQDKIFLIEALVESLDKPDKYIQEIWLKEAQARLNAHRKGKTKGVPAEEVLEESL